MATTPPVIQTEQQQPTTRDGQNKTSKARSRARSSNSAKSTAMPITTKELASLQKHYGGASLNYWRLRRYGRNGEFIGFVRIDCPYCGWYPQDKMGWYSTSRRKSA